MPKTDDPDEGAPLADNHEFHRSVELASGFIETMLAPTIEGFETKQNMLSGTIWYGLLNETVQRMVIEHDYSEEEILDIVRHVANRADEVRRMLKLQESNAPTTETVN